MPDDEIEEIAQLIEKHGPGRAKHLFKKAEQLVRERHKRPRKKLTDDAKLYILMAFECLAIGYRSKGFKSKQAALNEMFKKAKKGLVVPLKVDWENFDWDTDPYYVINNARTAANLHATARRLIRDKPEYWERWFAEYQKKDDELKQRGQ